MKTLRLFAIVLVTSLFSANVSSQSFTNYTTTEGLVDNNVNCVVIDWKDNLWFGTNNGISMYDGTNWTSFTTTSHTDLISDAIKCITVMKNGDIWVGSNSGAGKYDGTNWTKFTETDGLGDNRINDISEGADGKIWFGDNDGVTVYDGSTWKSYTTSDGLPFGGIASVAFDSKGDAWLGSGLGGLIHFDGTTFTEYKKTDGLVSNLVRSVLIDKDDNKWVGTADGISVLDKTNTQYTQHTRIFTLPAPDTINPVVDLVLDNHSRVWAGIYVDYLVTEGGLSLLQANQWIDYDKNDGLIGPVVRGLAVDKDNNIWIATSSGVSMLSAIPLDVPTPQVVDLQAYPNPSSGAVTLSLNEQFQDVQVVVRNAVGENVFSESYESSANLSIDIPGPSGMYYVELLSEEGARANVRVVKVR